MLDFFSVTVQFLSSLFSNSSNYENQLFAVNIAILLLTIGIYIFILWLFLFKTDRLINMLRLDKGFTEDKIDLSINRSGVLKIATIIIGGILFIDSFPMFCRQVFLFYQQKNIFRENPDSAWIIFYLVKVIIAIVLITSNQVVVNFINKQKVKEDDAND